MGLWLYLLAYAAGLASAPYLIAPSELSLLTSLSALLFLLIRRKSWASVLLLLLFFWLLGISLYQRELTPPTATNHIRAFVGDRPLTIEGRVRSVAPRYEGGVVIDLDARRLDDGPSLHAVSGRLLLYIDQGDTTAATGSRIRFISRLRTPRCFGLPGEFDVPRHLAYRDIFVTAYLADSRELVVFADEPGTGITVARVRSAIGQAIDRSVDGATAALVRALVIGDQSALAPTYRDLLAQGGVSHLFSISGLHLGLIAMMLYAGGFALYRRSERLLLFAPPRRLLPVLLLPILLGYLLLTGNAIATCRAFVMTLTLTLLMLAARPTPPLKLLASCAFLFLLAEPLLLFQPAFQLSFAGLFGILALVPRWQPRLSHWPTPLRYPAVLGLTTAAATLATTPLVLANFHLLAPAGLLTNLFAVPAIGCGAVPIGLLAALLLPLWERGAALLFQGCAWLIQGVLQLVDWTIRLPMLAGQPCYASPATLTAVTLLAACPLLPGGSRRRWLLRGGCALAAAILLLLPPERAPGLVVTVLSVGQGDAILLTLDHNRHFLIDGGGSYKKRFDVGARLVAPALGRLGVKKLEAVILTHDHPDHSQGLLQVLKCFPVGEFWFPQPVAKLNEPLRTVLIDRAIPIVHPPPGWSFARHSAQTPLRVFVPRQDTDNLNDASLVLLATHGRNGVLLTGDLEEQGIEQLLAHPLPQSVNLLKLPHHGSAKSQPEKLLDRIRPEIAFVSLGEGNRYEFPQTKVLCALRERGIPLWRTDRDGSLRFISNGRSWQATHWNQRLFR